MKIEAVSAAIAAIQPLFLISISVLLFARLAPMVEFV